MYRLSSSFPIQDWTSYSALAPPAQESITSDLSLMLLNNLIFNARVNRFLKRALIQDNTTYALCVLCGVESDVKQSPRLQVPCGCTYHEGCLREWLQKVTPSFLHLLPKDMERQPRNVCIAKTCEGNNELFRMDEEGETWMIEVQKGLMKIDFAKVLQEHINESNWYAERFGTVLPYDTKSLTALVFTIERFINSLHGCNLTRSELAGQLFDTAMNIWILDGGENALDHEVWRESCSEIIVSLVMITEKRERDKKKRAKKRTQEQAGIPNERPDRSKLARWF
ncbi:hypothetical protein M501DRAFT_1005150 [Patellaria atrata CBS 101060]|uniref:Uncharacterized protein n=1 Tax=Patellaria atrata CBS 101060 TaxID=1346257 RepID=A0A9P4S915_9PEZI|nr:hypothetical protein M501DRAFT_1005150 [Patellaria atrata CBS 101060]